MCLWKILGVVPNCFQINASIYAKISHPDLHRENSIKHHHKNSVSKIQIPLIIEIQSSPIYSIRAHKWNCQCRFRKNIRIVFRTHRACFFGIWNNNTAGNMHFALLFCPPWRCEVWLRTISSIRYIFLSTIFACNTCKSSSVQNVHPLFWSQKLHNHHHFTAGLSKYWHRCNRFTPAQRIVWLQILRSPPKRSTYKLMPVISLLKPMVCCLFLSSLILKKSIFFYTH